jgi:hypothetical protein
LGADGPDGIDLARQYLEGGHSISAGRFDGTNYIVFDRQLSDRGHFFTIGSSMSPTGIGIRQQFIDRDHSVHGGLAVINNNALNGSGLSLLGSLTARTALYLYDNRLNHSSWTELVAVCTVCTETSCTCFTHCCLSSGWGGIPGFDFCEA